MRNKGMSLIEVIVSIAILSVIVVCVCTFLQVGMNTSTATTSDATIQKEAQLVLNQLKDWIMEANEGIVTYDGNQNFDQVVAIYNEGEEAEQNYVQLVYYKEEEQALYYHKCMITDSFTGTKEQIEEDAAKIAKDDRWGDYLLSQYVEEFLLDTTNEDQQRIELQITYALQNTSYQVKQTIGMRNQPVIE